MSEWNVYQIKCLDTDTSDKNVAGFCGCKTGCSTNACVCRRLYHIPCDDLCLCHEHVSCKNMEAVPGVNISKAPRRSEKQQVCANPACMVSLQFRSDIIQCDCGCRSYYCSDQTCRDMLDRHKIVALKSRADNKV